MPQCVINEYENENSAKAASTKFFGTVTRDQRSEEFVHVLRF